MNHCFKIRVGDLRRALNIVGKVVERRATIPILTMMRLDWNTQQLKITTTDLDIEATAYVDCLADEPGSAIVPPHKLEWIAAGRSSDEVTVQFAQAVGEYPIMTIEMDGIVSKTRLLCPVEDWPDFVFEPGGARGSLPQGELLRLLTRVKWSISTEATRYYLNGVYLARRPGSAAVRAVSTNGWAMSVVDSECAWPDQHGIIPTKAVSLISNALRADANDPVSVQFSGLRIQFLCGGWRFRCKVIDGDYPNYGRILDSMDKSKAKGSFMLSADSFRRFMSSLGRTGTGVAVGVEFNLSKKLMKVVQNGGEDVMVGSISAEERTPESVTIGFNGEYIARLLRVAGQARFTISSGADPARITTEDPSEFFVLMPMRV